MWVWMRGQLYFLIPRLLHSPRAPSAAGQAGQGIIQFLHPVLCVLRWGLDLSEPEIPAVEQ